MCPLALLSPFIARAISIVLALVFDWALGDPPNRWHPVAWLGALIARVEARLRRVPALAGRFGGAILVAVAVFVATAAAWGLSAFAWRWGPVIGIYGDAALIYFTLSAASLGRAGRRVADALSAGDLEAAREATSHLVARDTAGLDAAGVARATVESLAENTVDGVVAPLFWSAVLGPAGAWFHKAVSTLDSMVGYRTEPYARFGTVAARLDDILVWLPARLTIPLVAFAASFVGGDPWQAWRIGWRDRLKHESPNSAHGEAAFAGALALQLGGEVRYAGICVRREHIGEGAPPTADSIYSTVRLLGVVSALSGVSAALALVLF